MDNNNCAIYWEYFETKYNNKNKQPKILLTYRNLSGCNTLALYKSIPNNILQHFDVEFVLVNDVTNEYTKR